MNPLRIIRYRVKGMDCAACVAKVETAVRRIDDVTGVTIGLQTGSLVVDAVQGRERCKEARL